MFIRMSDLEGMGQFGRGRAVRNIFDQKQALLDAWKFGDANKRASQEQTIQQFNKSAKTSQSSYDRTEAARKAREAAAAERRAKLEKARQRQADAIAARRQRQSGQAAPPSPSPPPSLQVTPARPITGQRVVAPYWQMYKNLAVKAQYGRIGLQ